MQTVVEELQFLEDTMVHQPANWLELAPVNLHKPLSKGTEQDMADMDQVVQARLGILPCLVYLEEALVAHRAVMDQEPVVAPCI